MKVMMKKNFLPKLLRNISSKSWKLTKVRSRRMLELKITQLSEF
jgi:hypothetical protein